MQLLHRAAKIGFYYEYTVVANLYGAIFFPVMPSLASLEEDRRMAAKEHDRMPKLGVCLSHS